MTAEEKLSRRIVLVISLLSLAGQLAWSVENQYYNVFLYNAIAPVTLYTMQRSIIYGIYPLSLTSIELVITLT